MELGKVIYIFLYSKGPERRAPPKSPDHRVSLGDWIHGPSPPREITDTNVIVFSDCLHSQKTTLEILSRLLDPVASPGMINIRKHM